jgi:5-formyltetrahydrofolate cyclo-ligase
MEIKNTKKALRKQYKALRQALPAPQLLYDSWAITTRLLVEIDWQKYQTFHVYLPMLQKHELNTYPLIYALWRNFPHLKICVPRVNIETQTLENLLFMPETPLQMEGFGQLEPITKTVVEPREIDIALVPLLVYDRRGYRVGYGKGYYDKFLPTCHPNVLKIGISQFSPIEKIEDVDEFDIQLDTFFTPKETYSSFV